MVTLTTAEGRHQAGGKRAEQQRDERPARIGAGFARLVGRLLGLGFRILEDAWALA
jgi:hypothetical protein